MAACCVVAPVPPFAIGSAVPDRVTANVPDVVIGLPDTDKNAGTVMSTLVTEPPPAVEAMVIDPVPLVIDIPDPAVRVVFVRVLPVLLPINNSPFV